LSLETVAKQLSTICKTLLYSIYAAYCSRWQISKHNRFRIEFAFKESEKLYNIN
jgi:hypothetical protein